jgi:signal transduction histidine kinase
MCVAPASNCAFMIDILRSTQLRLAALFTVAVTLSTVLVFSFVYGHVAHVSIDRLSAVLVDEVAKSAARTSEQIRRELELRLTRDLRELDYAALFDENGAPLYGNLKEIPSAVPIDGAAHAVELPRPSEENGAPEETILVAGRRADGTILLLGRSLFQTYYLKHTVLDALIKGVAVEILLATLIGVAFGYMERRRLHSIRATIDRILAGDLSERLPVRKRSDDIDRIVRAVNQMLDELVRALDQLSSVAANIAHDLRMPLTLLHARLERTLNAADELTLREAIGSAYVDVDRALTTVSAIMRIAEIESGRRKSAFRPVDLAALARDIHEFYEPLAEAKALAFAFAAPQTLRIHADADMMREAVGNLIDNAIKYTPAGGRVEMSIIDDPVAPVIRIADTGPGIALGEREKIFRRFYRSAAVQGEAGAGLGLSMAQTIAQLHGFDLNVSDNAPGARFEIRCGATAPQVRKD